MSALGTLLAAVAVTTGVVAGAKALKRRAQAAKSPSVTETKAGENGPLIDMAEEASTGVWRTSSVINSSNSR